VSRPVRVGARPYAGGMSWTQIFTTHEFWAGVPSGALVTGVVAPIITARSVRASDRRSAGQEQRMHTLKVEQEDLRSNRQIIREAANEFSAVCSSVVEKAIDSKGIFNTVMDAALTMEGKPDKKAMDKLEYAVDLMDETKRITTAFNKLRMVAPVAVLEKASALNAAVMALTRATTIPLGKPPLMRQAGWAFDDFTNAVRAELGLDPYTGEDAERAQSGYMELLTKQMNDYIKETQAEARRFGFLEPGALPVTTIKAGDLTQDHVGKLVGCHDPVSGFNYGAKIVEIIRKENGPNPGVLLRLSHPPIPGGKPAHEDRSRLRFDHELQLVEMPAEGMNDQPKFLGPVRRVAVRDLNIDDDISWPVQTDGTRSIGLRSTVKGFNADRTEMTLFVHRTDETVTVEVRPEDFFDKVA
jgi:hypothetical protein